MHSKSGACLRNAGLLLYFKGRYLAFGGSLAARQERFGRQRVSSIPPFASIIYQSAALKLELDTKKSLKLAFFNMRGRHGRLLSRPAGTRRIACPQGTVVQRRLGPARADPPATRSAPHRSQARNRRPGCRSCRRRLPHRANQRSNHRSQTASLSRP